MNIRDFMSKREKSATFTPKSRMSCECGKVCLPGPMKKHTNASGHLAVYL